MRVCIFLLLPFLFAGCKNSPDKLTNSQMDIDQTYWISDVNYVYSPWNNKSFPSVLVFVDGNSIQLNFSHTKHSYKIENDSLYINGRQSYEFQMEDNNTIILSDVEHSRSYIPIKKGKFSTKKYQEFKSFIEKEYWTFPGQTVKFSSPNVVYYREKLQVAKTGVYAIEFLNNQILLFIISDGSLERETYFLDTVEPDRIVLHKLLPDNSYRQEEMVK